VAFFFVIKNRILNLLSKALLTAHHSIKLSNDHTPLSVTLAQRMLYIYFKHMIRIDMPHESVICGLNLKEKRFDLTVEKRRKIKCHAINSKYQLDP
jgi:hypothetical protein